MTKFKHLLALAALLLAAGAAQAERLKDIASIQGVRTNQLIGYGLVVGLSGSGDQTTQTPFTLQTFNNMLAQFGIKVPANVGNVQLKNVAAVSVHADLPPFAKPGQPIDVTVSSIGNAKSLRGGSLLMTPLKGIDGQVYAVAQGNLVVGGFDAEGRHRNQQGAALNPWTGRLWTHEHGPRGGDEINIPQAGGNYGWPLATHGINYTLLPIPEARGKAVEGTEAPHHVWEKSPAISGMAFYDAQRFPAWQHNLFIGALATQELIRLQLDGDRIVHEERLLGDLGVRIRDVRQGPDGYLYLLTDQKDGQLLRLGLAR